MRQSTLSRAPLAPCIWLRPRQISKKAGTTSSVNYGDAVTGYYEIRDLPMVASELSAAVTDCLERRTCRCPSSWWLVWRQNQG